MPEANEIKRKEGRSILQKGGKENSRSIQFSLLHEKLSYLKKGKFSKILEKSDGRDRGGREIGYRNTSRPRVSTAVTRRPFYEIVHVCNAPDSAASFGSRMNYRPARGWALSFPVHAVLVAPSFPPCPRPLPFRSYRPWLPSATLFPIPPPALLSFPFPFPAERYLPPFPTFLFFFFFR